MSEQKFTFLELAEKILFDQNKPLSAREITAIAIAEGLLTSEGQTPWHTMKSKLSMDVLNNGEDSKFMRVFQGLFALRSFGLEEYKAVRYKKNKLEEDIAVIRKSDLFKIIRIPGYVQQGIDRTLLSSLATSMNRRLAEDDFSVIQLVSVFIVFHDGKVLTHMRSARLPEQRLHGEYSLMLGGHLSIEDFTQLTLDLFQESSLSDCSYILRELSEELILNSVPKVTPKGYIYDVSRDVSKQHLGLVYLVELESDDYKIGERGFLMNSQFEDPVTIENRIDEFENWSVTLLANIKNITSNV